MFISVDNLIEHVRKKRYISSLMSITVNLSPFLQARELLKEGQLSSFVDKRLKYNYSYAEAEEMVQLALLCTMYRAAHRPRMSEVVRMLEGDGSVAGRWESLKDVKVPEHGTGTPKIVLSPAHYSEEERSSVELEAVELSGPR
jgi:hypothetical protein